MDAWILLFSQYRKHRGSRRAGTAASCPGVQNNGSPILDGTLELRSSVASWPESPGVSSLFSLSPASFGVEDSMIIFLFFFGVIKLNNFEMYICSETKKHAAS